MKESDLYPHIKSFFIEQGYDVKAEIADCDVMAVKDDIIVIVEMKTNLNLPLLGQAAERQLLFDIVYIAVPKPQYKKRFSSQYKRNLRIVKRLNLGLIYVDVRGEGACIEEFPPKIFRGGINKTRRQILREKAINEFKGLSGDYNIGGTNKVKKMTAYKESAISIAMYLDRFGPAKASQIKKFGCGEKTWQILYSNFYGWFEKKGDGVYSITDKGREDIKSYSEICAVIERTLFSEDK
ncbi:MAG: hypothetical protein JXN65_08795 [Clostridia bacterium]|nr:hypothetical protein [Clostridia bacterium]